MNRTFQLSMIFLFIMSILFGCKQEKEYQYVFEVNEENLYLSNVEKTKQKTPEQYISILYSNLFSTTVPPQDLSQLAEVRASIGDKQMADEMILNDFVNSGNSSTPTNQEMRANVDQFIEDTYIRFFLRKPSPYEVLELKQEIDGDVELTPEMIYQAFALSNEYKFY